jgi:hypothetical protein
MKKSILKLSLIAVLAVSVTTACKSPGEKLNQANENATEANNELEKANEDYLNDIADYKIRMSEVTAANDKSIAEFKERIAMQKAEAKEDYKAKIAELEKKNSDNRKKMDDYKANGKENWANFKAEFSRDMDELGAAFKDLTVNNVK